HSIWIHFHILGVAIDCHLYLVRALPVFSFFGESLDSRTFADLRHGLFDRGWQVRPFELLFLGSTNTGDDDTDHDCRIHCSQNAHGPSSSVFLRWFGIKPAAMIIVEGI